MTMGDQPVWRIIKCIKICSFSWKLFKFMVFLKLFINLEFFIFKKTHGTCVITAINLHTKYNNNLMLWTITFTRFSVLLFYRWGKSSLFSVKWTFSLFVDALQWNSLKNLPWVRFRKQPVCFDNCFCFEKVTQILESFTKLIILYCFNEVSLARITKFLTQSIGAAPQIDL